MRLDFHIAGFHPLQLRNLVRLDRLKFLFVRFPKILLDSGSVISHRNSSQVRDELARDFQPELMFLPTVVNDFDLILFPAQIFLLVFAPSWNELGFLLLTLVKLAWDLGICIGMLDGSSFVPIFDSVFPTVSIDMLYRVRTDWISVVKISKTKLDDFYQ